MVMFYKIENKMLIDVQKTADPGGVIS